MTVRPILHGVLPPSHRASLSGWTRIEYCEAHGYPHPQFFDAADDSGNAINLGATAAPNAVAAGPHAARYKVWVVLGEERLELPTSYAGIKEGEEKMARKVLRHLRSRDMGEVPE